MPSFARREIVVEGEIGTYHCIARCVRRAFLCGFDAPSNRSFDHRKDWIQRRLEELAGIFAIDIIGFAVMSNHLHLILRQRPDLAAKWSDNDIAERWIRLHPKRGATAATIDLEREQLAKNPERLSKARRRLGNLSWFMRCLCEPIARRANAEDGVKGRFFEGRFRSLKLLSDAALLACSVYVDLNPIRAKVATTPEQSRHTSAYERIAARWESRRERNRRRRSRSRRAEKLAKAGQRLRGDWLSPMRDERSKGGSDLMAFAPVARASDDVLIPMDVDDYLNLLDWTGRELRADKPGAIPSYLAPILQRLEIEDSRWLATIAEFGRRFKRAVGTAAQMVELAGQVGRHWLHGVRHCRQVFAT